MDYRKALQYFADHDIVFDYVFLDPPYGKSLVDGIIAFLEKHHLLNDQAIIVVEELKEVSFNLSQQMQLIKRKEYGITAFNIFCYQTKQRAPLKLTCLFVLEKASTAIPYRLHTRFLTKRSASFHVTSMTPHYLENEFNC